MTEATSIIPVPAGTLSDKDYEDLVVGAMPSPKETVASGETKPKEKPPRVCSKCGHSDGNSVGKIRRGRMAERWDKEQRIRVWFVDWFCQSCLDHESELPEAERDPRPVLKGGYLIALCGLRNKEEAKGHAVRTAKERYQAAKAAWRAILAGEKPFENGQPQPGRCEFEGCEDGVDTEAFAVVNGQLRTFCRLHAATLREIKVGQQNKDPRFVVWRGPEAKVRCQRHLAWLRRQADEAERRATPASSRRIERLKDAFGRRRTGQGACRETAESRRAREHQAAYAAVLRTGGSLSDVLAVSEKTDEGDNGWAEIDAYNRRSEATCAAKRGKGGKPKKDGKGKGGKPKKDGKGKGGKGGKKR
jgi:hypothetical protein